MWSIFGMIEEITDHEKSLPIKFTIKKPDHKQQKVQINILKIVETSLSRHRDGT